MSTVVRSSRASQVVALLGRWRGSALLARVRQVAVATVVSKLLTLVSLGYAARRLGPESWGLVGAALAAVAYASVLLSPGLMTWGTREIARDRRQAPGVLLVVNLTQIMLACMAFAAVAVLGAVWLEAADARAVLLASALGLFAQALSVDWVFDGLERSHVAVRLQVVASAGRLAAVVWLCHAAGDAFAYAAILPLFLMLQALAGYVLLLRQGYFRPAWPRLEPLRRGLAAAWPLGVTMALFLLAHNANTLIVQYELGSRAAGEYVAALRFVEMASVLPGVVGTVFRPRLSRLSWTNRGGAAEQARLFARAHLLVGWLLAPLVFAEAPWIIAQLYGEPYAAAAAPLRILSLAVLGNFLVCGYTNCLVAFGRDRALLRAMALAGAVAVGAGLWLTPSLGTAGAALGTSLIHPLGWLLGLRDYRRTVGTIEWSRWTRPVGAAAAVLLLSWVLAAQGLAIGWRLACYGAVYLCIAGPCWTALERSAAETSARPAAAQQTPDQRISGSTDQSIDGSTDQPMNGPTLPGPAPVAERAEVGA